MGISQPQQPPAIYDASGRFIAPAQGNEAYAPAPPRLCAHGALCAACGKR